MDAGATLQDEIWLPVLGYEGRYFVSNRGNVRSARLQLVSKNGVAYDHPHSGRVLKQTNANRAGRTVELHKDLRGRTHFVSKLVCEAFHGPRPDGMWVLHGDGNNRNNEARNLRWGTPSDNVADAIKHGARHSGERSTSAKLTDAQVAELRRLWNLGGHDLENLAAQFGISKHYAFKIKQGTVRRAA